MKSKLIIAWLLGLFAWNAVFGAFGGILLCLHEDQSLHLETGFDEMIDCAPDQSQAAIDLACVSQLQSCVDIELTGDELPTARITQADPVPTCSVSLIAALPECFWGVPSFRLNEIAKAIAPRAPPVTIAASSVLVVQLMQPRV